MLLEQTSKVTSTNQPGAFTLLEVMIALAIFFMAVFALLDLTTQNLKAARNLQPMSVGPSSLAAFLSLTNRLIEGVESGDFGELYPDYAWSREIYEVSTNGLFQVDFTIVGVRNKQIVESKSSILLYRPLSPPGGVSSGMAAPGVPGVRR